MLCFEAEALPTTCRAYAFEEIHLALAVHHKNEACCWRVVLERGAAKASDLSVTRWYSTFSLLFLRVEILHPIAMKAIFLPVDVDLCNLFGSHTILHVQAEFHYLVRY